jgi:hypothetical protein
MLTTLPTLKRRLALDPDDTTYDALLTSAANAISARFDQETNRTLARTVNATHEFDPADTEILVPYYPIESVAKFELKTTESEGWIEQPEIDYLIRSQCIISLAQPLAPLLSSLSRAVYTGGYLLLGSAAIPGASPLPADLEHACVEQVAHWFQTRDYLGLKTHWPSGGTYLMFTQDPLLPAVAAAGKPECRKRRFDSAPRTSWRWKSCNTPDPRD